MANETMVLLEKIVVPSAGASNITFTSIPQSYTDLLVKVSGRSTSTSTGVEIAFNNNSTSYTNRRLYGTGSSTGSDTSGTAFVSNTMIVDSSYTASTFGNGEFYIPNYTSSDNKSVSVDGVTENNSSTALMMLTAGLWSNSAAITSIKITPTSGSFAQYSTFYLYGVAKQGVTPTNAPAATGGDSIVFDGTYWIHTFRSSGTFTPKKALTADYAVVGGGGGGGSYFSNTFSFVSGAGGGGGGGVSSSNNSFASGTNYSVTIGAGATASYGTAGSGTTSSLIGGALSISSNGGSGGGNGGPSTVGAGGTAGTGGGAGGSGGAFQYSGDAGSNGTNVTWSATYGGGGGGGGSGQTGGAGGTGGGGAGMDWESLYWDYAVLPGTANTGGGGGGATQPYPPTSSARKTGGNGGSGIVIVRYAA